VRTPGIPPGAPHPHATSTAVVADVDAFARRALVELLQGAGISVVAQGAGADEVLALVRRHRPDVVVLDIDLRKGEDGVAITRRIVQERDDQVVIVLSCTDDDELAVQALRAGAMGFLCKSDDADALPRAVQGALRGEAAISRRLAGRVVRQLRLAPGPGAGLRPVHSPLTAREWEVLDLMIEGGTTDELAAAFVVSSDTIRTHVKHIFHKLGVNSRAQAVAEARRMRGH
jgi:DNA-binding NarL/FixJ family response regulator